MLTSPLRVGAVGVATEKSHIRTHTYTVASGGNVHPLLADAAMVEPWMAVMATRSSSPLMFEPSAGCGAARPVPPLVFELGARAVSATVAEEAEPEMRTMWALPSPLQAGCVSAESVSLYTAQASAPVETYAGTTENQHGLLPEAAARVMSLELLLVRVAPEVRADLSMTIPSS